MASRSPPRTSRSPSTISWHRIASTARSGASARERQRDRRPYEIKTSESFPTLVNGLSDIPIEPKHYPEAVGREGMIAEPMGTGPFAFKDWGPATATS